MGTSFRSRSESDAAAIRGADDDDNDGGGGEADNDEGGGESKKSENTKGRDKSSSSDISPRGGGAAATEQYPICWFEDEDTCRALRWHLFVGVLYDLMKRKRRLANNTLDAAGVSSTSATSSSIALPWKIRVHFSSYPSHEILQLDYNCASFSNNESSNTDNEGRDNGALTVIERTYNNSLKQALFLQYGSSKVAMSITKLSHKKLWDAIIRSNYSLYHEVNVDIQADNTGCRSYGRSDESGDGGVKGGGKGGVLRHVPVRLLVDGKPAIQRPFTAFVQEGGDEADTASKSSAAVTLGSLLVSWTPNLFHRESDGTVVPVGVESTTWAIQGIEPPLTCPVVDLWKCLCHPDHFLYISVVTGRT